MAAGDDFSVAVLNDGSVWAWAWGDNYDKALGNTAVNGPYVSPYPVQVMGVGAAGNLGGITGISASRHVLAIHSVSGGLSFYAWGVNTDGQLGDQNFPSNGSGGNGTQGISSPVPVSVYLQKELPAPTSVSVVQHLYGTVVSWSPVPGASGYVIERGVTSSSGATVYLSITHGWPTTSFVDATSKSGTFYQYRVYAGNSGGRGLPSEAVAFTCPSNAAYCHLAANDSVPSPPSSLPEGLDAVTDAGASYPGAICELFRIEDDFDPSSYPNQLWAQTMARGAYGTDSVSGQGQDDGLIGARSVSFKGIDSQGYTRDPDTLAPRQLNSPTGMVVQNPSAPLPPSSHLLSVLNLPLPGVVEFSVSLWVNPASGGGGGALIANSYSKYDPSAPSKFRDLAGGFCLGLIQSGNSAGNDFCLELQATQADGTVVDHTFLAPNDPILAGNQWHHVVLTSTGSQVSIFVDGQMALSRPVAIVASGLPLLIGNCQRTGRQYRPPSSNLDPTAGYRQAFLGQMDDIRIFGHALTEGAVADLASESIPLSLTKQAVGNQVSLFWKPSPQATSYTVLRSLWAAGPFVELPGATTLPSYTDATGEAGNLYFYRVRTNNPGFAGLELGEPGLYTTQSKGPLSQVIAAIFPPGNPGGPSPTPTPLPFPTPSWKPPTPPPPYTGPPLIPCSEGLARANGGRVSLSGDDAILLKMPKLPSDPPATGRFTIRHSIVTYNTPRNRDLHGRFYMRVQTGNSAVIDMTKGIIHPDDYLDVVEPNHSGCGEHDRHFGDVPFEFTAKQLGSVKLVFGVDPDPEDPEDPKDLGKPENSAALTICVADPKIGVDGNRDGEIDLEQDSDETTQEKPYRFWLNDDNDMMYLQEPGTPPAETETVPAGRPDYSTHAIFSKRNLEDFTRLWISLDGMQQAVVTGTIQVGLKWSALNSGSPAINIYPSKDAEGSLSYITDDKAAGDQIKGVYGKAVTDNKDQSTVNGTFIFKPDYWNGLDRDHPKKCLLFEGAGEGKGELQLVFYDQNADGSVTAAACG